VFLDWPLAAALLRRSGIASPPVLRERATRGEAASWELPMESKVPISLTGEGLPASVQQGREAEGVVVKCWAESRGLPLAGRLALAACLEPELKHSASGREYMRALGMVLEGTTGTEPMSILAGDTRTDGVGGDMSIPAAGDIDPEVLAGSSDRCGKESAGILPRRGIAPWVKAVMGLRGRAASNRLMAKIKCSKFEEIAGASWKTHGRASKGIEASSGLHRDLVLECVRRLTDGRFGAV